jgi:alkylation response protein AidB-like acyl-CoA dehydrogenase
VFRQDVRRWLETSCPLSMRTPMPPSEAPWGGSKNPPATPEAARWLARMADKGWTLPTAPIEYGGGGLTPDQHTILQEELLRIQARPPLIGAGVSMVAPVLLDFGTDEQKKRFLPEIAAGKTLWAQGFSEPDAGSDLASLRTRAVRDGGEYIVNGQKIWTSKADQADWILCLVRTDRAAPKPQQGISMLLIDMKTPGVSVRPIRMISGESMFCETFFDEVRVPADCLVGQESQGWTIAKAMLVHERQWVSVAGDPGYAAVDDIRDAVNRAAHNHPQDASTEMRLRAISLELEQLALDLAADQLANEHDYDSAELGVLPNVLKVASSELIKARNDLAIAAGGIGALGSGGELFEEQALKSTRAWLYAHAGTIAGGATEIQLNIIANAALGRA